MRRVPGDSQWTRGNVGLLTTPTMFDTAQKLDQNSRHTPKPMEGDAVHIPPHRAWAIQKGVYAANREQRIHLLECGQCLRLFQLCASSESFGAVLKVLNQKTEE